MWIKICGIKNKEDLRAALRAEPDAVGFVLGDISPLQVRALLGISTAETVLVTEEGNADKIISLWLAAPADTVQIANPAPELLQALRGSPFRVLPSLQYSKGILQRTQGLLRWTDRVILHAPLKEAGEGGSWNSLREIFSVLDGSGILAGGLRPENIIRAISESAAWGVDASSALRDSQGALSSELCQEFVSRARLAKN